MKKLFLAGLVILCAGLANAQVIPPGPVPYSQQIQNSFIPNGCQPGINCTPVPLYGGVYLVPSPVPQNTVTKTPTGTLTPSTTPTPTGSLTLTPTSTLTPTPQGQGLLNPVTGNLDYRTDAIPSLTPTAGTANVYDLINNNWWGANAKFYGFNSAGVAFTPTPTITPTGTCPLCTGTPTPTITPTQFALANLQLTQIAIATQQANLETQNNNAWQNAYGANILGSPTPTFTGTLTPTITPTPPVVTDNGQMYIEYVSGKWGQNSVVVPTPPNGFIPKSICVTSASQIPVGQQISTLFNSSLMNVNSSNAGGTPVTVVGLVTSVSECKGFYIVGNGVGSGNLPNYFINFGQPTATVTAVATTTATPVVTVEVDWSR